MTNMPMAEIWLLRLEKVLEVGEFNTDFGVRGKVVPFGGTELQMRIRKTGGRLYLLPSATVAHCAVPSKYTIAKQWQIRFLAGKSTQIFSELRSWQQLAIICIKLPYRFLRSTFCSIKKLVQGKYRWENATIDIIGRNLFCSRPFLRMAMVANAQGVASMKAPVVSIIMPAYNVERWIKQALDSVLMQTFSDWECLVVDDGSSDKTPLIVSSVADARIRLISQANQGVTVARNKGLEVARGHYIAFLDADDVWHPQALERKCALPWTRIQRVLYAGVTLSDLMMKPASYCLCQVLDCGIPATHGKTCWLIVLCSLELYVCVLMP